MTSCFSQDMITLKTSEDIESKVLEITNTEIKYKKSDNMNGPIFTLQKSDVLMIRYENGTKDIFNKEKVEGLTATPEAVEVDLYTQGQTAATKSYKGYKGAGNGTFFTSILVSPLIGLIPAIACSSTQPKEMNLNYPSKELMNNSDYYDGYTQKARKIKQNKVWTNWGVALALNIAAYIVLTSGQ